RSGLRGVVALAGAYAQARTTGGAHGDALEAATRRAVGVITEKVLRLEFCGDLAKDRFEVFDFRQVERLAAGLCRHRFHRVLAFDADGVQADAGAARVDRVEEAIILL